MIPNFLRLQLQTTTNKWLTERATIQRQLQTRGSFGEQIHDWTVVGSNIDCRVITIGNNSNASDTVGNQEVMLDTYKIVLRAGTDIGVDDLISVGGRVYRVTRINDDRTDELDINVLVERER